MNTYYEYATSAKTAEDFGKKYKMTDDVKSVFESSKSNAANYTSLKVENVEVRTLYYYSSDKELTVSYKVTYKYKTADSEEEKTETETVRAYYSLTDTKIPSDLSMPYDK